jgi:hypothetical protein
MNYSVTSLTSAADCDAALALANKEKGDLDYKVLTLTRSHQIYQQRSLQLATQISATQAEMNALTTVLPTLPEGKTKTDNFADFKKAEYRLFTLQKSFDEYGVIALLEKELELNYIDKQLAEVQVFIQAIEARKAAL